MQIIRFRRLNNSLNSENSIFQFWEIAFSQDHLNQKLNGEIAEVIMPAKSLFVQLWRKIFPPKEIKAEEGKTYLLKS